MCSCQAGFFQERCEIGTKAIAAGGSFTCALRTDDTIACWGSDTEGQASPPEGAFVQVTREMLTPAPYVRTTPLHAGDITTTDRLLRPKIYSPRSLREAVTLAHCDQTAPSYAGDMTTPAKLLPQKEHLSILRLGTSTPAPSRATTIVYAAGDL